MDLYMQIGMVFAVMTAFAAFIFVFNSPADMFVGGAAETQDEINNRIADMQSLGISHLLNNAEVSAPEVATLIEDASARGIAVLYQSKRQQGLVVNYGKQLRNPNATQAELVPSGFAGEGIGQSEFEKNFVQHVYGLMNYGADFSATADVGTKVAGTTPVRLALYANGGTIPTGETVTQAITRLYNHMQPIAGSPPGVMQAGKYHLNTKVMYSDPRVTVKVAQDNGRTFSSTGFFYTDNTTMTSMPENNNFSGLNNKNSVYSHNKSASFYSTLILGTDGKIKGIYFEEHGVDYRHSLLGIAMLQTGTITQLY